jgi:hypothetical protein
MMGKVLEAAGLPNEYNTATFIQYMPIIGPVRECVSCLCWLLFLCMCAAAAVEVLNFDFPHCLILSSTVAAG